MKRRMVILTNTCPFGGETFLLNELEWIPPEQSVTLYPIFAKTETQEEECISRYINVRKLSTEWTVFSKLMSVCNSFRMLIATKEYSAALKKPNVFRNLIKAFKFAYISELRKIKIEQELRAELDQGEGVIFYSYWLYETAYIAARLKKSFPKSRVVSRCHGFDLYEVRHPNGYLPFRNYLMTTVDKIFAISKDGRDYIGELYDGKWLSKVSIARLGTCDNGLNPNTDNGIPFVVSCSNLVDVKRVDRIIEGLSKIKHPIRWYHFGDGVLRESLEIKARKLPKHIDWAFKGSIPNDQLLNFYKENHVDAFINVSSSEGVPVSIMEALSFGIPAIATDVGGTHEIVCDGINGYLLPADFSNEMLCEAILRVTDQGASTKLREQARKVWEKKCDASVNFATFFQSIVQ